MRETITAIQTEQMIRESRIKRHACPFARQENGSTVCSQLEVRCGDRLQFSPALAAEDSITKQRPHLCLREKITQVSGLRILVVDDDAIIREMCVECLRAMGVGDCLSACSGKEAQTLLDQTKRDGRPVHLVITDVHMGADRESGYALARYVDSRNFPCFVIFISGRADMNEFKTANSVVKARIRKPFRFQQLSEAITLAMRPQMEET